MSTSQIQSDAKMQSLTSISTGEIQHAFQKTRPQTRRKRTASTFAIAEDPENNTSLDSKSLNNMASQDVSAVQPWKSLRSRHVSLTESSTAFPSRSPISKKVTKSSPNTTLSQTATLTSTSSRKDLERVPLASGQAKLDKPNVVVDRMSPFPGKENIPPGTHPRSYKRSKIDKTSTTQKLASSNPIPPTKSEIGSDAQLGNLSKSTDVILASQTTKKSETAPTSASTDLTQIQPTNATSYQKTIVITQTITSRKTGEELLIEEEQQQIIMIEVINSLFDVCRAPPTSYSSIFKHQLLQIYHDSNCSAVLKKIAVSIWRGALKYEDEEAEDGTPRLTFFSENVDMRLQFINLWTESYEHSVLQAALEIMVGKNVTIQQDDVPFSIRCFIESYLLLNEDAQEELEARSGPDLGYRNLLAWRRTLHQSHILIMLMDQAKLKGFIHGNLFRDSSRHRSSLSVLQQLNTFMRGSHSEAIRVLKVLGYKVTVSQESWTGYDYHFTNFEKDFKDGVRMARLLELVTAPRGQGVWFGHSPIIRASDLKYPAKTKAARETNVYEVMYALDPNMDNIRYFMDELEIASGDVYYTTFLLWQIVNYHGIKHITDLDDLTSEIARLDRAGGTGLLTRDPISRLSESTHLTKCHLLLRLWLISLSFKHGIQIVKIGGTLTAKPNPFTAIVKEYLPYIIPDNDQSQIKPQSLKEQLQQLGCGTKFAALLSHSHNFDRAFLMPVLAFMAFKVLNASKGKRGKAASKSGRSKNSNRHKNRRVTLTTETFDLWWEYLNQQEEDNWFDKYPGCSGMTSDEEDEESLL